MRALAATRVAGRFLAGRQVNVSTCRVLTRSLSVDGWLATKAADLERLQSLRPARIILIRHGESMGNLDEGAYVDTPDWQIQLSDKGVQQARTCGKELKELVGGGCCRDN